MGRHGDYPDTWDETGKGATKEPKEPTMPFGKYKGHTLKSIAEKDLSYIKWLEENTELREPLATQVKEAHAHGVKKEAERIQNG